MAVFTRLDNPKPLFESLEEDIVLTSHFLARVSGPSASFRVYATEDMGAALAVEKGRKHVILAGDWTGLEVPKHLFSKRGFFVSASPASIVEKLKEEFTVEGEWPCWHYLAPIGYGPGPWDELGPLKDADVSFIAPFWELGGDDREEHIRDSVKRYHSACVRSGGKPISWCGLHFQFKNIGNLGFAHTLEGHRRRGYARIVTKALINKLSADGARATADVIKDNKASIAVCKSLGFEVAGELTWADFRVG